MKSTWFTFVIGTILAAFTSGCFWTSPSAPPPGGFSVLTEYGSPGAYAPDTTAYVSGSVIGGSACSPNTDPNCILSFGGHVNSSGIYNVGTDAVGGVTWNISGNPSANCRGGYPAELATVGSTQQVPLVCGDQTSYFTASPGRWAQASAPSTVTYTAVHSVFPGSGYTATATFYDQVGNVQGQGNGSSSSQTVINAPVEDNSGGKHIVVFRNPSTGAVMGSGAYFVYNANPCTSMVSGNPVPRFRCPTCCT